MRKLVGSKVKLLTTADGKVEKVEGGPQLRSKVTAGANMYVIASLNNMLSDEAIKGWNTLHTGLPDKAVKPGDSWPSTRSQTFGPGTLSVDATNTFKGWEQRDGRKVALFESAGVIISKPAAGNSPVTVTVEDGATTSGKTWFDPALGCVIESTATSDFSIKMAYANGQSTASKAKVVANTKLTDAPNPGAVAADTKPAEPAPDAKPAKKPKTAEKP